MSHRFVRCPHCKMPHDATERVCPNTGLRLPENARPATREPARAADVRSRMTEVPPSSRPPEPLAFDAQRDRVPGRASGHSGEHPGTIPPTRDLQRELLGQTVGGRYKIKGVLGEGGMGTVYDAEHLGLSRQVAIKVLSPSQAKKRVAVKRFQQEARAAGAIGHPNICEVYDLGLLDDGSPYLVMEKLVGQTLADRIAKEGGLPFDEVVDVVSQVLSGLVAAHEKGIVHRDIKPENIFLARRLGCPPIIKLLDFGVSKMMAEFQTGDDALDLTRTGMVMGTPYYMSPEQARGERNLDGRVDVYACGVVMYETLAGKRPFLAPNYNALLLAIINTAPRSIRDIRPATPPELEAILRRAMEKNRADRYPTAKQMLRDLAPPGGAHAEGGGARLPAPPTAEERKRAQVLGGRRSRSEPAGPVGRADRAEETRIERPSRASRDAAKGGSFDREAHTRGARPFREPLDPPDGPSATLRSRMADGGADRERGARLDARVKLAPSPFDSLGRESEPRLPSLALGPPSDDSIDIPIHIALSPDDEDDIPLDEEDPTEVFHPGKHRAPRLPAAAASRATRGAPGAPVAPEKARSAPPSAAADDWDGETVVKRPDHLPPSRPPAAAAPQGRPPNRRDVPFNPEETMKLDGSELEVIENRRAPPRRH
ncbi:MAG: serine/threonine protein kinase [Labilithrix sp.]|nr:serine/threonine protein kinase [Labilithrix sp.]